MSAQVLLYYSIVESNFAIIEDDDVNRKLNCSLFLLDTL